MGELREDRLDECFIDLYMKFKLGYYQKVLQRFQSRVASLTADEAYSAEAIYSLGTPTVGEFAAFVGISPQSAAYKVGNLVKKGYITKTQDPEDKREHRLQVTERYMNYYVLSNGYIFEVVERIRESFAPEEQEQLQTLIERITGELTPEISQLRPYEDRVKTPHPAEQEYSHHSCYGSSAE